MNSLVYVLLIQFTLLASLTIYFQEKKDIYLMLFPPFLLVTDVIELVANNVALHHGNNTAIYNPFEIFEFCFYFFALMRIVQDKTAKKVIGVLSLLYLLFALYNVLFGQKEIFNSMSYAAGALLTVSICIYYFFELFQYPHAVNLLRQPAFWICSGLLFFYSCTFPIFGLANFFEKAPRVIIDHVGAILNIVNILLYSTFTIAFLCGIRTRKSTS